MSPARGSDVEEQVARLPLVDHHCHGVLITDPVDAGFDAALTEGGPAPGATNFDTPVGLSVRRHCAPLLDLEPHAPPAVYLQRRRELGAPEVNRRFLAATGTDLFCVDTGFRPQGLTAPDELARLAGRPADAGRTVVRLEHVAEDLALSGTEPGEFAAAFPAALERAVREQGAVGVKSVAAYRCGFDWDPARPDPGVVAEATARWYERDGAGLGTSGEREENVPRLDDPVLERHLLWSAVDLGLPIQFHVGFGDADIRMHRVDPSLLTDWLHLHRVPVLLLHTWPYHRQAGYLACVHPHVHLDLGLTLHNVGVARGAAVLAEAMEVAPFTKLLYSSDAFGLGELYHLAALVFRSALGTVLRQRVEAGEWAPEDGARVAALVAGGNARRVYGLPVDAQDGASTAAAGSLSAGEPV